MTVVGSLKHASKHFGIDSSIFIFLIVDFDVFVACLLVFYESCEISDMCDSYIIAIVDVNVITVDILLLGHVGAGVFQPVYLCEHLFLQAFRVGHVLDLAEMKDLVLPFFGHESNQKAVNRRDAQGDDIDGSPMPSCLIHVRGKHEVSKGE